MDSTASGTIAQKTEYRHLCLNVLMGCFVLWLLRFAFQECRSHKHHSSRRIKIAVFGLRKKKKKILSLLSLAESDGELPAGHQDAQVQHLHRLVVRGHDVIFADDPADSQVELELS